MSVKTKVQDAIFNTLFPKKKTEENRTYMLKYDALMGYPIPKK